jgi:hypothetical protein
VSGLVAGLEGKNSWTLAERAGEVTPDGMQRPLRRAFATVAAGAGTMTLGTAGVADAATRPQTTPAMRQSGVPAMKTKHNVTCTLENASTGAGINDALINLDRNGRLDNRGNTSNGGIVSFVVTVHSDTSATFQCILGSNNSFISR